MNSVYICILIESSVIFLYCVKTFKKLMLSIYKLEHFNDSYPQTGAYRGLSN